MKREKKIGLLLVFILLVTVVYGGIKLTEPSYALRMDVNPSIEIVSNRLNRVVEVNPLNDDAKEMLKDYKITDKNLKNTIEDLADLMVLKGYITGGKDNLVMISVEDENVSKDIVNKLNKAIVAYLQNKQIEATIVNQSIPKEDLDKPSSKEIVAKKIIKLGDGLNYEMMADMTLRELIAFAESNNITPQSLFNQVVKSVDDNENNDKDKVINNHIDDYNHDDGKVLIGEAKAKEIALGLVNGKIVEFKLDDDDDPEYEIKIIFDGYEYEIEIDAYKGKVEEFQKDDKVKTEKKDKDKSKILIGEAKAKEIALGLVNG